MAPVITGMNLIKKVLTLAIVRVEKTKNYSVIANTGLRDERLSWKARGILAYLLTLPDGWTVYLEEVEKHSEIDGRESFRNGIKELKQFGYFETVKEHDEKGHFETVNYVFENPRNGDNPTNGKPVSRENRLPENTTLLNTNQSSTDLLNTDKNSSSSKAPDPFIEDMKKYGPVSQFYQDNYHSFLAPINAQVLDQLVDKSSSDLVIAAMKVALKEDNKRISYVEGIINKWLDANVTTLDEAREFQRKWQEKKGLNAGGKKGTNVSNIRSYHGRPSAKSYEESLREVAAAKAVWN
jgi:DnaD/phage-associated family protein